MTRTHLTSAIAFVAVALGAVLASHAIPTLDLMAGVVFNAID
jgi:hypothetical protein